MSKLTERPKGLIVKERDERDFVKGFSSDIPYLVRNSLGDWSQDMAQRQSQKYGRFETNDCWCLAGINSAETQCNFLKRTGQFPQESLNWFMDNGYFDSQGRFDFSERFIGIISGVRDEGNDQIEFWRLARLNGLLPRKDLAYTEEQASRFNYQHEFASDYFNPAVIKPEMRQKALNSLKHISIVYEWIGKKWQTPDVIDMRATLLQSPLQIGIPVPRDLINYNSGSVIYDGSKGADHSILLWAIYDKYDVRDQYNPYDKTLSKDYYIPLVTHGYITPILTPPYIPPTTAEAYPKNMWTEVWTAVKEWFNNLYGIGGELSPTSGRR